MGQLAAGETRAIVLKLASPVVPAEAAPQLAALDFTRPARTRCGTGKDWLAQGARFEVPEQAVNDLFRANLWHALMLPRFRDPDRIDLPYSNFAYGQLNADWPINQAVYVDYMLYGLRGLLRRGRGGIRGHVSQPAETRRARRRLRRVGRLFAGDALFHRAELPALGRPRVVRAAAAGLVEGARLVPRGSGARADIQGHSRPHRRARSTT